MKRLVCFARSTRCWGKDSTIGTQARSPPSSGFVTVTTEPLQCHSHWNTGYIYGPISTDDAHRLLKNESPGTCLFRFSDSKEPGKLVATIVKPGGHILDYLLEVILRPINRTHLYQEAEQIQDILDKSSEINQVLKRGSERTEFISLHKYYKSLSLTSTTRNSDGSSRKPDSTNLLTK